MSAGDLEQALNDARAQEAEGALTAAVRELSERVDDSDDVQSIRVEAGLLVQGLPLSVLRRVTEDALLSMYWVSTLDYEAPSDGSGGTRGPSREDVLRCGWARPGRSCAG